MKTIQLNGKTSLISGASGQLGRTIAKTLAECGSDVILCYHKNHEKAKELENKIKREYGVQALSVPLDVRSLDAVLQTRDKIQQEFRMPDILVNCAVSQIKWTTILEQDMKDYQDQVETAFLHHVVMIKAFVPYMVQQQYGRVIGINTECAAQCFAGQSAYAAAKRGMDGIYRVLAREVGKDNITVNQIAPGWMISERERLNGNEDDGSYAKHVPLGHRGEDEDIANAVAFLASDLAKFISGVYLPVCGGNIMPGI